LVPQPGRINWSFTEFTHFINVVANDPAKRGTRLTILVDGEDLDKVAPVDVDDDYSNQWLGFLKANNVFWQKLSALPTKYEALRTWSRERALAIKERKKDLVDAAIDG
jgi:hypothetical protein